MAFKYKGLRLKDPSLMKRLRRVPNIKFTRASVAYDKYGNSVPINQPRFGMFNGPDEGILIEEAHTNLLPADASQALTTESPYTTGTLNGTYTFSCMTGSYELSGGATGTVTPTSPQTKTITSATVTLTGTATFNQCTKTGYPLSWTLGGTTMAAETLTAPSSVLSLTEGTIEAEVYVNSTFLVGTHSIIDMRDGSGNNRILMRQFTNNWDFITRDGSSSSEITYSQTNTPVNNWYDVAMGYGSILTGYINGNIVGTPVSSPKLPVAYNTLYIGKVFDGSNCLDTIVRNVVISKTKRTDPDIANRSGRDGFGVDRQVTLIAPLKNNLNAYRVATV